MLIVPLVLVAIGLVALGRHSAKADTAPVPTPALAQGAPSPLIVLDSFVARGETPPPDVILCAIAQAETMGRLDVAQAIVEAFVIPVVAEAERSGGLSPDEKIAVAVEAAKMNVAMNMANDMQGDPPSPVVGHRGGHGGHGGGHRPHGGHRPRRASYAPNYDDGQVIVIDDQDETAAALAAMAALRAQEQGLPMPGDEGPPTIAAGSVAGLAFADAPAESRAPVFAQGTARIKSPIPRVDPASWASFVSVLAREPVDFAAPKHVGQFRHRIDRLAELGIRPDVLHGNGERQIAALEADMRDAYQHAHRSGMFGEHVGNRVDVPNKSEGRTAYHEITMSGVLGVIQAAGLEGAADWFSQPADRVRFPHTTLAFLRTNGVF